MKLSCLVTGVLLAVAVRSGAQNLTTRWAAGVTPENVHREYPRPQLVRSNWVNLNGIWNVKFGSFAANEMPVARQILVPFPVESSLSRIGKQVPDGWFSYERSFKRPVGDKVLLHIGACDWDTSIFVNQFPVLENHQGGFDPITVDITKALRGDGDQRLAILVNDPTDSGPQPRGKQVRKPGGIFYTPTSGIWQTVWLESVPSTYIENLKFETWPRSGQLNVTVHAKGPGITRVAKVEALDHGKVVAQAEQALRYHENLPEDPGREAIPTTVTLKIPRAKWWSPEKPNLYDLKVTVYEVDGTKRKPLDQVTSYFAFREFSIEKDKDGVKKFFLNGKPYFLMGTLDQGFWPDGLYTAPSDEALKYDLEVQKRLGFNFIRKHVKVEPDRWYYWCDKMGLLVMQDMPSGDRAIGPDDPDIQRSPQSQAIFKKELKAMIDNLSNHPSIFSWVVYNEGWGQWNTAEMSKWVKDYDPSRVVNAVTGWADRNVGDFKDWHIYPGPGAPSPDANRAIFLGEYGGLGLPVPDHMWLKTGWGYQSFKTKQELTDAFCDLMFQLRLLRSTGLSGAVYTQTTDVETELNGLMTYDRAMLKMDEARIKKAIADVYLAAPKMETIVPTSESIAQTWTISTQNPGDGWVKSSNWPGEKKAVGGFGTFNTPGAIVKTVWNTPDIWIRRPFSTSGNLDNAYLRISYDDDVEVYIDGKQVYKAPGWTTSYKLVKIGSLKSGIHEMRIHVHQNSGGQYIDAGIVRIK